MCVCTSHDMLTTKRLLKSILIYSYRMPSRQQSESRWPATSRPLRRCWWELMLMESRGRAACESEVLRHCVVDVWSRHTDPQHRPDSRRLSWRPTSRQRVAGSSSKPSERTELSRWWLARAASALRYAWCEPSVYNQHIGLHTYVQNTTIWYTFEWLPPGKWKRHPDRLRSRWLDQLCQDNQRLPADLWRRAIRRDGHPGATLQSPTTTR